MKKNWIIWSLLGLVVFTASACKDDEIDEFQARRELLERQKAEIAAYIEQNNITATPDSEGIYQEVVVASPEGQLIEQGDVAVVHYKLKTLDGTLVGASEPGKPERVLFSGLDTRIFPTVMFHGLKNVRVGGTYRYYAPSYFGFKAYTDAQVPQNANVILEYEIVDVIRTLEEIAQLEQADIQAWLEQENLAAEAMALPNGLHKVVLQEGTGTETVVTGDSVWVRYKGYLLSKEVFDDNLEAADPMAVKVGTTGLIKGFTQALKTLKVGEKSLFIMPSAQAYGVDGVGGGYVFPRDKRQAFIDQGVIPQTRGDIPPLSPLIFEIELIRKKE